MIKMVVSSFYNTLIDLEDAIPTSTMLQIERLHKKKILFSVCTNRRFQEILEYNKDFPFVDYIISLNGSYIYDVENGKSLFKSKLSTINLKKVTALFEKEKMTFYGEDKVYKKKEEIGENEIYKIEVEFPIHVEAYEDALKKMKVNYSILEINNKKYLEITSSKANMFVGVDKISLKNSIGLKEIMVICANDSDVPMVKNIPNSYIMKNSAESLKRICENVTFSNDNKGVENVLKKLEK